MSKLTLFNNSYSDALCDERNETEDGVAEPAD